MEETYLLAMRCPVYRRRDSHPGFRTELENLDGNAKGEGPSGGPARPTAPMCRTGADCSVVAMSRGNGDGMQAKLTSSNTGSPSGDPNKDQLATRERQAGPCGVAERSVLPKKPGNSGGGKGPQLKTDARSNKGHGD